MSWLVVGFLVLMLVLVGFGVTMRVLTSGGTDADPAAGGVVVMNRLRMSVERELPGFEAMDATVWEASPAPEPRFDTSDLGPDLSFGSRIPPPSEFERMKGDVVWLGYSDGYPMAVFQSERRKSNLWDHIYAFVMGHSDRLRLDATFPCCARGVRDDGTSAPGVMWPLPDDQVVMQWIGTPEGTSVVAFEVSGERIGFQRPVGGIVSLEIEVTPPVVLTLTALDVTGDAIATEGLPLDPVPEA